VEKSRAEDDANKYKKRKREVVVKKKKEKYKVKYIGETSRTGFERG